MVLQTVSSLTFAHVHHSFMLCIVVADDGSQSDRQSSLSDLSFDSFSSALAGETSATTAPRDSVHTAPIRCEYTVRLTLPEDGACYLDLDEHGASASACWHGRSVLATMILLMMLSSAQFIIGVIFAIVYVGIPTMASAVMGVLVSSGQVMGYIPGDHLEKQVKTVRHTIFQTQ